MEAAAIDAALAAGVRRVVKISGGAPSLGLNGVSTTAVAHWRSERRIEDAGLGFTFLPPSMYQQGVLGLPRIAGRLLVAPLGRAPIARALARRGASTWEIEHALRMAAYYAASADAVPTDHVLRLTGRPPRPVQALLDEHPNHTKD